MIEVIDCRVKAPQFDLQKLKTVPNEENRIVGFKYCIGKENFRQIMIPFMNCHCCLNYN